MPQLDVVTYLSQFVSLISILGVIYVFVVTLLLPTYKRGESVRKSLEFSGERIHFKRLDESSNPYLILISKIVK